MLLVPHRAIFCFLYLFSCSLYKSSFRFWLPVVHLSAFLAKAAPPLFHASIRILADNDLTHFAVIGCKLRQR